MSLFNSGIHYDVENKALVEKNEFSDQTSEEQWIAK